MHVPDSAVILPANAESHAPTLKIKGGKLVPHSDRIGRVTATVRGLARHAPVLEWEPEYPDSDRWAQAVAVASRVHTGGFLTRFHELAASLGPDEERLAQVFPTDACADTFTPLTSSTPLRAAESALAACHGALLTRKGAERVIVACRPPGHHATSTLMGGYCYLNNTAIAASLLSEDMRVGILDIDAHHGNGTQEIFYATDAVAFSSIHAATTGAYPYRGGTEDETGYGKGQGFTQNLPVHKPVELPSYLRLLEKSLDWLSGKGLDVLVVSLGFDTHRNDAEDGGMINLDSGAYAPVAAAIVERFPRVMAVLEGGYSMPDLEDSADAFAGSFFGRGTGRCAA